MATQQARTGTRNAKGSQAPVCFIGIDPGRHGAVAVLSATGTLVLLDDCDTLEESGMGTIANAVRFAVASGNAVCSVEFSPPFGVGSKHSVMRQGYGIGVAVATAKVAGASVLRPTPREWKAALKLNSDKELSVTTARELFGAEAIPEGCRHDRCEAALLAWWTYLKHNKNS